MKRFSKALLLLSIVTMLLSVISVNLSFAQSTTYKISGYILDSNGQGIADATIIFNVPTIVPSVKSDSTGHYAIYAPAGTYHVNVWPAFDSHYVSYNEDALVVSANITKNITLPTGYKVSGYLRDPSGNTISGAGVFLNGSGSGWFSTAAGYYFVNVPAGVYTLMVKPFNGITFPIYYEYSLIVTQDLSKNIIIPLEATPTPTPTPPPGTFEISGYILNANGTGLAGAEIIFGVPNIVPSVITDSSGHYVINAPAGTYHLNVWPPFDSNYLSYDQSGFVVTGDMTKNITLNTGYKVSGYLTDSSGAPIRGALVSLNQYHCGWYSKTDGRYFVTAPAGTYTLKIQPKTGPSFTIYTEANFAVNQNIQRNFVLTTATPPEQIFKVESNSTVSYMSFNSTSLTLSFTVSGPSGTTGYTKASIAKTLVPTFTGVTVALDGKNLTFTVGSTTDYWVLEFNYGHSTHQVLINVDTSDSEAVTQTQTQSEPPVSTIPEFTPFALVFGVIMASVAVAFARKKLQPIARTL